jgi:hypothetical protein
MLDGPGSRDTHAAAGRIRMVPCHVARCVLPCHEACCVLPCHVACDATAAGRGLPHRRLSHAQAPRHPPPPPICRHSQPHPQEHPQEHARTGHARTHAHAHAHARSRSRKRARARNRTPAARTSATTCAASLLRPTVPDRSRWRRRGLGGRPHGVLHAALPPAARPAVARARVPRHHARRPCALVAAVRCDACPANCSACSARRGAWRATRHVG